MRILLSACKKYRAIQHDDNKPKFEIVCRKDEKAVGDIVEHPLTRRWGFIPVNNTFFPAAELMDLAAFIHKCRVAFTGIDFLNDENY